MHFTQRPRSLAAKAAENGVGLLSIHLRSLRRFPLRSLRETGFDANVKGNKQVNLSPFKQIPAQGKGADFSIGNGTLQHPKTTIGMDVPNTTFA